jgi:hypothetical protein
VDTIANRIIEFTRESDRQRDALDDYLASER